MPVLIEDSAYILHAADTTTHQDAKAPEPGEFYGGIQIDTVIEPSRWMLVWIAVVTPTYLDREVVACTLPAARQPWVLTSPLASASIPSTMDSPP